jgi:hypothetical protein
MSMVHKLIAAACLACAAPAFAQATLDHNKALAGGITRDDQPGYPITLSQPGHYKLMGNLVVPAGVNGISITADDVTLDLNGFRILGAGSCSRNPNMASVSCAGHSGGNGIAVEGNGSFTSTIRNGSVRGFNKGVSMEGGLAEDLELKFNDAGLYLMASILAPTHARGISAFMNNYGVRIETGALVERSVASSNTVGFGASINLKSGSVKDSLATMNQAGFAAVGVQGNRAKDNKTDYLMTVSY